MTLKTNLNETDKYTKEELFNFTSKQWMKFGWKEVEKAARTLNLDWDKIANDPEMTQVRYFSDPNEQTRLSLAKVKSHVRKAVKAEKNKQFNTQKGEN